MSRGCGGLSAQWGLIAPPSDPKEGTQRACLGSKETRWEQGVGDAGVPARRAGLVPASCQMLQDERRAGRLFRQPSQGNLLNLDGLANSGFVWEEMCVSRERDVLREPAWGHLRSHPEACSGFPPQRISRTWCLDS